MTALALQAPAKINLHLEVGGKRADGYHELRTLFHSIELRDELALRPAPAGDGDDDALTVVDAAGRGLDVAAGADNLVIRAVRGLRAAARGRGHDVPPLELRLTKRIPAGAGLGGGSADAAAALRLVRAHVGLPIADDELCAVGATLGADVPFFVAGGGTRVGRGTGTELATWRGAPPELHLLLFLPPYGTSTKAVYENYQPQLNAEADATTLDAVEALWTREGREVRGLRNDLETAACVVEPRLAALRQRIRDAGFPGVCVSGSGSTMFCAFVDASAADAATDALAALEDDGVALLRTRSERVCALTTTPHAVSWPR